MQISDLIAQQAAQKRSFDLEELNLASWRASEITPEAKTSLERFSLLRELTLEGVGLSTLAGFPVLARLKRLNLKGNQISTGLNALKELGNLMKLDLSSNPLRYLADLRPLVLAM